MSLASVVVDGGKSSDLLSGGKSQILNLVQYRAPSNKSSPDQPLLPITQGVSNSVSEVSGIARGGWVKSIQVINS